MVSALLLLAAVSAPQKETRILFLGNSHTSTYDVPKQVEAMLESDGKGRKIHAESRFAGFLNDFWDQEEVRNEVGSGRWNVVVLQAAKISSSHKYQYGQTGGINLANLARNKGARTMLFVEWPRRGWNESNLQMAVYKKIQKATKAELIPVCYSWDRVLSQKPKLDLWAGDGNHSNPAGAYLASAVIYYQLTKGQDTNPNWKPQAVDAGLAKFLLKSAKETVQAFKG